jgi:ketosteroid isomerase-like protein
MATLHAGRKVREEAILENGGKAMAITDSTTTGELGIDSERVVRDVLERFRDAYDRRDVDGAVELFADDAVLVFAPRTFNGKDEIRHGLEWDAKLSPTSRTRLSGIEVLAKGNVAVAEGVVQQTADGIGYECPVVTVIELGDDHKIRRMSSYYDRLAIMQQVAAKSSGLRGEASKRLVNLLVSQAEQGLKRPEVPRENWDIGWRWLTGGDPSLIKRLRDAVRLAGVIMTGPVSQRPVRALGDEAQRRLPGDELVPAKVQYTNAITIHARPSAIWPWLVQMGCGHRAGAYSYDGLDNGGIPSAERIIPELQHVEVGDILPWTPTADDGFIVRAVEPERALVLGEETGSISWAFVLEPIDETSTRLIARGRTWYKTLAARLMIGLFHPIHFGMQRRQLLNLKRRAETRAQ